MDKRDTGRLPDSFTLPTNLPVDIEQGLKAKNLTRPFLAKFVTIVAHAMYGYARFPARDDREKVVRMIMEMLLL